MYWEDYEEGNMVFEREDAHVARKKHKCEECKRTIYPGERYHSFVGLWEPKWFSTENEAFFTVKTCEACEDDWRKIQQIYSYNHYDAPRVFGELKKAMEEAVSLGFLGEENRRWRRWLHS